MTHDEMVIIDFLSGSPDTFFSRKEISRRAAKRADYEASPRWADPALASLVGRGVLETDDRGCFRLKKGAIL